MTRGQRGGGNGGKGFTGTIIKDTWRKPRGRMEAREGGVFGWAVGDWCGGSADNCN